MSAYAGKSAYLFVTLSYNHEAYILEHLESIRYQIEHWGNGRSCSIIIADDCSRDETVRLARSWLEAHRDLLVSFLILDSPHNAGTCANFVRVFPYARGKLVKVLAGDDLYSAENIFDLVDAASERKLVSGLPLMLFPDGLAFSRTHVFNMLASEALYSKDFIGAMKGFSAIHTPSLAYDSEAMDLPCMAEFVSSFSVVEDFAMQTRVAEARPQLRYVVDGKFYVYYRRTRQSTYLIKNSAFIRDKTRIYRYLAERERNLLKRTLIRNRIPCLRIKGILKYIVNANTLFYALRVALILPRIMRRLSKIDCPMERYRMHLKLISDRASAFTS